MAFSLCILRLLVVLSLALICKARLARLVVLNKAAEKGAVCLDGSPPGYYFRPGTGSGANKWVLFFMGGSHCSDLQECFDRSMTMRGSTKYWPMVEEFDGMLSDDRDVNPDFCSWNLVFVIYCDGTSFANFLSEPVFFGDVPLYFRGRAILKAVFEDVLELGAKDASEILLVGTSAGAVTVYLNADRIRNMIPQHIPMKAVADAGFFFDTPNRDGDWISRREIKRVFSEFNITAEGVDEDCANVYSDQLWRCWFPSISLFSLKYQNMIFYHLIQTPIFTVHSAHDPIQLDTVLELGCSPEQGDCDEESLKAFNRFREDWLAAAHDTVSSSTNGIFVHSCFRHVQIRQAIWAQLAVRGRTIQDAVGDWYFGRRHDNTLFDCAHPCNPTCFIVNNYSTETTIPFIV